LKNYKKKIKKKQELTKMREEITRLPLDLRRLCNTPYFLNAQIKTVDIDTICYHVDKEEIRSILEQPTEDKKLNKFNEILINAKQRKIDKEQQEKLKQKQQKEASKLNSKPWTNEELNTLAQAVGRYPGGTTERWQKIHQYCGKHRSIDEIIAKVRELSKRSRNVNVPNEKEKKSATSKDTNDNDNDNKSNNNETKDDIWTVKQQKSLELALKEAKSLPMNERWEKVASMVPGKTKEQCIERYKFIRDQLLSKKIKPNGTIFSFFLAF